MAMNEDSFDPTEMIVPANPITHGWRKTVKVTVGEGPMFDESSTDSESESSISSPKVLNPMGVTPFRVLESSFESVKEPIPPLLVVPASSMAAFDVLSLNSIK